MHNCKSAKSSFIDLALDEIPPVRSRELLAELNACRACREEYAALRSTLHVSGQALRSASPEEDFWPGYHYRLRHSLLAGSARESVHVVDRAPDQLAKISNHVGLWLALRTLLATSVRVPVPAAVALMALFVITVVGLRSHGQGNAAPTTPLAMVETRSVPAPVVQEKVITRIVYIDRKNSTLPDGRASTWDRSRPRRERLDQTASSNLANGLAGSSSSSSAGSGTTALNLTGFEPTDQIRLTVIKGSYRDEK
jgi:hypothetical protein